MCGRLPQSVLLLLMVALPKPSASALTVSGHVTESDGVPVGGIRITVEQIGGELPLFTTQTRVDGSWSVSDPLLTGNIRVTPASAAYTLSPPSRDSFTFENLIGQDFTASPTTARPNITVLSSLLVPIPMGGTHPFGPVVLGKTGVSIFDIRNDGTSPLGNIHVEITNAPPGEFALKVSPPSELGVGALGRVVIEVLPTAIGVRTATVVVRSDDPNENPYIFQMVGTAISFEVTNTNDSGPGSLRQAILNRTSAFADNQIHFHPSLSGGTITLSNEIAITDPSPITIDASSLPGGLTLDGNNVGRIFSIGGADTTLSGLTFIHGKASGVGTASDGGAVYTEGTLFVTGCTFSENTASFRGGALSGVGKFSSLTISNCTFLDNFASQGGAVESRNPIFIYGSTFAGNVADVGGAFSSGGRAVLERCTFTGNLAFRGGALNYSSALLLDHCTIVGNDSVVGGGVHSDNASLVTIGHSIIAGNHGSTDPEIHGSRVSIASILGGDALLAPLDDYGGPTKTIALLPGSPARNAATNSNTTVDQRGFPIVGVPDIGAYESGTFSNFNAFVWEQLPPQATEEDHGPVIDFDSDGADNLSEWLALTDPADPSSVFRITLITALSPSAVEISFISSSERRYILESSVDLSEWTRQLSPFDGVVGLMTVRLSFDEAAPQRYFRAVVVH